MPRGGARKGAGRTPDNESGAMVKVTIKVPPELPARLKSAADGADMTHAEVLEAGVVVAERKAARRTSNRTTRSEKAK